MKVACTLTIAFGLFSLASTKVARAQFSPAFLQNESYWGDGKAEVDFYDAQVMRDGQLRHCELMIILVATKFTPDRNPDDKSTNPIPPVSAIRLSQQLTIPRGLTTEQRSSVSVFAREGGMLKSQLAVSKPEGVFFATATSRIAKPASPNPGMSPAEVKTTQIEVSRLEGASRSTNLDSTGMISIMREELPLRVRMLDFSKSSGDFKVRVLDVETVTQPTAALDEKLAFKTTERDFQVDVGTEAQHSHFVVDRDFPFLLREWKTPDGSTCRLKNSLRVDYQKFMREGDREKALKDPMLRHPD